MAGPYYCDLGQDYVPATGLDSGANCHKGVGGLWDAIHGASSAMSLAAGETLYLKGTGTLSRLTVVTTTSDHSATWEEGDAVESDGGGSADWSGVIIDATAANVVIIELVSGKSASDMTIPDGIKNTTAAESDTTPAVGYQALKADKNAGSAAAGYIHIIGVDASWADVGGTTRAVLDADSKQANAISIEKQYHHWKNVEWSNSTDNGVTGASNTYYQWFQNCLIDNAGNYSIDGSKFAFAVFEECILRNSSSFGCFLPTRCRFFRCTICGAGNAGLMLATDTIVDDCVICNNAARGVWAYWHYNSIRHCVIDNNKTAGIMIRAGQFHTQIIGNRITHNDGYGIEDEDAQKNPSAYEDYNAFYENVSGELSNVNAGTNSHGDAGEHTNDDMTASGYVRRTLLITYDNGSSMTGASVGDAIVTAAGWGGTILTVPTGDATGTFEANITSGFADNNDTFTIGGVETGTVNGVPVVTFTGDNGTIYHTARDATLRSVAASVPVA